MEQDECAARFRFQPIGFKIQEKREGKPVKCGFSKTIILDEHGMFQQDEVDEINNYDREQRLDMIVKFSEPFGEENARYVELKLIVTNGKCTNEERGLDFWSTMVKHCVDNLTQHKSIYDGLTVRLEAREIRGDKPIENGFNKSVVVDNLIFDFPNEEVKALYSEAYDYALERLFDLVIRSPKTLKFGENGYLEYRPILKPVE